MSKKHGSKPGFWTAWQSLSHFLGQRIQNGENYIWKAFYFPKVFSVYCWKTKNGDHQSLWFFKMAVWSRNFLFFCRKSCILAAILKKDARLEGGQFYIFWYTSGSTFRNWTQKKGFFWYFGEFSAQRFFKLWPLLTKKMGYFGSLANLKGI